MLRPALHVAILIALLLAAGSGHASMIHKWVDQNGVTHYSDEPPPDGQTLTTRIELPEPKASGDSNQENYYSIANQWARMHQERLDREKTRARENVTRSAQRPSVTNVYINESDNEYGVVYGPRFHKKHHRKHKQRRNPSAGVYPTKYPPGLHPGRNSGKTLRF